MAPKLCEECGARLSFRNEFIVNKRLVCRECRNKLDPAAVIEKSPFPLDQLAQLDSRLFAQLIDGVITYLIIFAVFFPLAAIGPGFLNTVGLLLGLSYFLLADGLPGGQSLGKRVMKIKVLDEHGRPCNFGQSFLRNLTAFLGILDWAFIFGVEHRRLGDRAANTWVVRKDYSPQHSEGEMVGLQVP